MFLARLGIVVFFIFFCAACTNIAKQREDVPVVINVLDRALYDDCHIPGSIQVPFDKVEMVIASYAKNKDSEIVLYCSNYSCTTSHYVAQKLYNAGYTKVKVYEGGIAEWYQAGLKVVGPAKQEYLAKQVAKNEINDHNKIATISVQELAKRLHMKDFESIAI